MKIVCIVDNTVLRVVPPLRVTDIIIINRVITGTL